MAEELVKKIEKLIVDGNKEVLERIGRLEDGQRELKDGQKDLSYEIKAVDKKVDTIDKKIDTNTNALYGLLKDVQKDVKNVCGKLDEHIRQPAHA